MSTIIDKPRLYPVGTRVISIKGETSATESAQDVFTGPNATGGVSPLFNDVSEAKVFAFELR